jgi:hypothetical protein
MSDTSDYNEAEVVPLGDSDPSSTLCFRCRRISTNTLFVSGGFQHCGSLKELIKSAKDCDLCELFRAGLQKDISDKLADEPLAAHKYIYIKPQVWRSSQRDDFLQPGLQVCAAETGANCKLNWYLSDNGTKSSDIRLRLV